MFTQDIKQTLKFSEMWFHSFFFFFTEYCSFSSNFYVVVLALIQHFLNFNTKREMQAPQKAAGSRHDLSWYTVNNNKGISKK